MIYAEVIGDPIAQSKSPVIHGFWLGTLGIEGDYRATRVTPDELATFFASRRADPEWARLQCHRALEVGRHPLPRSYRPAAERIGAVNCIYPDGDALVGLNTDVDGIAEALFRRGPGEDRADRLRAAPPAPPRPSSAAAAPGRS